MNSIFFLFSVLFVASWGFMINFLRTDTNFLSNKIELHDFEFFQSIIKSTNPNFKLTPYSENVNKPFCCKFKKVSEMLAKRRNSYNVKCINETYKATIAGEVQMYCTEHIFKLTGINCFGGRIWFLFRQFAC